MTNLLSLFATGMVAILLLGAACFLAVGIYSIALGLWRHVKDWREARRQWRELQKESSKRNYIVPPPRRGKR